MRRDGWWLCSDCDVLFNERDQGIDLSCDGAEDSGIVRCPVCGMVQPDDDEFLGINDDLDWDDDDYDDECNDPDNVLRSTPHIERIGIVTVDLVRVRPRGVYLKHPVYRWLDARGEAVIKHDN